MFESLEVFRLASHMAKHAGQRQALVSENVANADTPGYVARDIPNFQDVVRAEPTSYQRATRAGHMNGMREDGQIVSAQRDKSFGSVDGNTVSIESEMLKAVETQRQHDRALTIYKSALDVLRMTLNK